MLSIVFIHGALLGGWIWKDIAPCLEREGHEVFAPDLPGRSGGGGKITLESYVKSISVITRKAKHPVVLVAHSMGGIVASQLAENLYPTIKKVIFVSAYLPQNGQSLRMIFENYFGPLEYDKDSMCIKIGKQLSIDDLVNASFDDCPSDIKTLVKQRAVSEPIGPSLGLLALTNERYGSVQKAFIRLSRDKIVPLELQDKMILAARIKDIRTMETNHTPFCSNPSAFLKILNELLIIS